MSRKIVILALNPDIGKQTHYPHHFLKDSRVFPMKAFEKHLVFYTPRPEMIEILDIVHGARDIEHLY